MAERESEIKFGTTFIANGVPNQKFAVTVVEGEGWFLSARILRSSTGNEYLTAGPAGNSQDIQEILGQLSYDEIIVLAEEGARQNGRVLSQEEKEIYSEHSQ